ncbi:hypothetical protein EYF80_030511 [Liparis tanakae]|uniref:Uncharacterized protein n=1 Tax=Liparis tanakae TaxID=230148 RepID=A0A4Z2H0D8_9TELE|nr:hypothetical protein EYF80_030511 [Liparis tanakae]
MTLDRTQSSSLRMSSMESFTSSQGKPAFVCRGEGEEGDRPFAVTLSAITEEEFPTELPSGREARLKDLPPSEKKSGTVGACEWLFFCGCIVVAGCFRNSWKICTNNAPWLSLPFGKPIVRMLFSLERKEFHSEESRCKETGCGVQDGRDAEDT